MLRIIVATAGMLAGLAAFSGTAFATANCPAWTTAKCVKYSCTGPLIGGTCTCTQYQCVADKQSDPPKAQLQRYPQSRPGMTVR